MELVNASKQNVRLNDPEKEPREVRANPAERRVALIVCVLLALGVFLVFGQTVRHGFVNFDDNQYVYENPQVCKGLDLAGVNWAFLQSHADNWHPLTWLSHMLDCQWFGLNAGLHHLTNVVLHALTAILLFLVLRRMTRALWPSALVAMLFAVHPLRVESVAWVAERKDVLSGLFFVLTLGAYARYVEASATRTRSWSFYGLAVLFFALGLMSKPMLVTQPFVLLLLDWWPLQRVPGFEFRVSSWTRLVIEKIPFFVLSAASCAVTVVAQKSAVATFDWLPLSLRAENAIVSCVTYLVQMIRPAGLAVFYPYPENGLPAWRIALSLALLAGVSAAAFVRRRKQPFLLTGWCWYLGMLVPVIGIMQVGEQAHADRYTYLPQIGIYLLAVWTLKDVVGCSSTRCRVATAGAAVLVAALMAVAWKQTTHWRNSESLWRHALAITSRNSTAHNNLGIMLADQGRDVEAIEQLKSALEIRPRFAQAHNNLGTVLLDRQQSAEAIRCFQQALGVKPDYAQAQFNLANALASSGKVSEAVAHYREALRIKPDYANAHYGLGAALVLLGRAPEAIAEFERALQISPDRADIHYNLGVVLAGQNRVEDAVEHFRRSVRIKPDDAEAHYRLGLAFQSRGRHSEAVAEYRRAVESAPEHVSARNNLAWILATSRDAPTRDGGEAIRLALAAQQFSKGTNPAVLDTLAAAYAESGQFPEAVETAKRAINQARAAGNISLAESIRSRLKLYETNAACRE